MTSRPSEDDLIARYFRPLARDPAALALVDDCAALTPPPGCDLVLKTDAVAEGVHFFAADPWDTVAKKALRVNLSDLAAKVERVERVGAVEEDTPPKRSATIPRGAAVR